MDELAKLMEPGWPIGDDVFTEFAGGSCCGFGCEFLDESEALREDGLIWIRFSNFGSCGMKFIFECGCVRRCKAEVIPMGHDFSEYFENCGVIANGLFDVLPGVAGCNREALHFAEVIDDYRCTWLLILGEPCNSGEHRHYQLFRYEAVQVFFLEPRPNFVVASVAHCELKLIHRLCIGLYFLGYLASGITHADGDFGAAGGFFDIFKANVVVRMPRRQMIEQGWQSANLEAGDAALVEQLDAGLAGVKSFELAEIISSGFFAKFVPICLLTDDAFDGPTGTLSFP